MKVIIKSYYKDSSLFKKGIFVDPIPSNSTQEEIESFLREKITHEGLSGNYSKSELEFIEKYLTKTIEYENAKKFKWKTLTYIFPIIFGAYLVFKLVSVFFGWIVFLSIIVLIGYPLVKGISVPKSNSITATILIVAYFIFGGESQIDTDRCLKLSDLAGTWTSIDDSYNHKRAAKVSRATGVILGEVELNLKKDGTYIWKEWSMFDGELKDEKNGTWSIDCKEDKNYNLGEVTGVDYTNTVKLSGMTDSKNNFELDEYGTNVLDNEFARQFKKNKI